jgi:hypothetical protein
MRSEELAQTLCTTCDGIVSYKGLKRQWRTHWLLIRINDGPIVASKMPRKTRETSKV